MLADLTQRAARLGRARHCEALCLGVCSQIAQCSLEGRLLQARRLNMAHASVWSVRSPRQHEQRPGHETSSTLPASWRGGPLEISWRLSLSHNIQYAPSWQLRSPQLPQCTGRTSWKDWLRSCHHALRRLSPCWGHPWLKGCHKSQAK